MRKSLFYSLRIFGSKDKISFHVPGHKNGYGISSRLRRHAFEIDVTEFDETDNLQNPNGILKDVQTKAAEAFGAFKSYYLTNGSTIGIQTMILGSLKRGESLIVDRNCHKSVISSMILGGINPVFIYQEFNSDFNVYTGISPDIVRRTLNENPNVKGALITSPTYYGVCSDLERIADILHSREKFLLVDEAHGAHFAFSDKLPKTALECGADICVQSVHKTLSALTQCAILHINKTDLIDTCYLEQVLRLLQTTSPSYLLMTSIDEAVNQMASKGSRQLDRLIQQIGEIKTKIYIANRISYIDSKALGVTQDITRLVLNFTKLGITGFEASEILKNRYGIYAEMADLYNVVFVITSSNTKKDLDLLEKAIEEMYDIPLNGVNIQNDISPLPRINLNMPMHDAFNMNCEYLPLRNAIGRVCGEILSACPPGAAVLVPGQEITAEAVRFIEKNIDRKLLEITV